MRSDYSSQFQLPRDERIPAETVQAVYEQRLLAEHAEAKRVGEQAAKLRHIHQDYRQQLVSLMGSSNYETYRGYVTEQKRLQAKLMFSLRNSETAHDKAARFRQQRREESRAFLSKLGIDPKQLQALSKGVRDKLAELAPAAPSSQEATTLLASEAPQDIRANTARAWSIVRPPYAGWAWGYAPIYSTGFTFTPTLFLDHNLGLVGNINRLDNSDASDNDVAVWEYTTLIQFWYQMPVAGLITAWLEAESRRCRHHLSLIDEVGWSDASVTQRNLMVLRATVGGGGATVFSQTCWFNINGQSSGYWDERYFNPGTTYWHNVVSASHVIIPAGAWVLVEVGTQNWNSCMTNDVEVYSTMDFEWLLKSVHVNSTGA